MIQSNSRVEMANGIQFYEQDILFDDYPFAKDIQVTMVVDYISPGIGVALIANEGLSIREKLQGYLFRLGFKESSVIYRNGDLQRRLSHTAVNVAPLREGMVLTFTKRGKEITLQVDDLSDIIKFTLPRTMDKYNIGFYSNAGNVIKSIAIASLIPEGWRVNMKNTAGGYIRFLNNGFTIEGCQDKAEIEQSGISLDAGTYYLKYEKELIQGKNDIEHFVFLANDERIFDTEKNILQGNLITLSQPAVVNLKMKGTHGTIRNISVTNRLDNAYVATVEGESVTPGSYLQVDFKDLKAISWAGTIHETPNEIDLVERETFGIMTFGDVNVNLDEALTTDGTSYRGGVMRNREYHYWYTLSPNKLVVTETPITLQQALVYPGLAVGAAATSATVFRNMNAVISRFSLEQTDGKVLNLIAEKTSKKYVSGGVTSPIIATDEDGVPLELSSSYRIYQEDGEDQYLFTNYEREYFEPDTRIQLSGRISQEPGVVRAYGILEDQNLDLSNLLRIGSPSADTIDAFCEKYDIFNESDLQLVDRATGEIYFHEVDGYQMIVVDYLKKDSYAINYDPNIKMHEVDISTDLDNISLLYDSGISEDERTVSSSEYKLLEHSLQDNSYIAIRRS